MPLYVARRYLHRLLLSKHSKFNQIENKKVALTSDLQGLRTILVDNYPYHNPTKKDNCTKSISTHQEASMRDLPQLHYKQKLHTFLKFPPFHAKPFSGVQLIGVANRVTSMLSESTELLQ